MEQEINKQFENNSLISIGNKVFIRSWHLEVLKKYDINTSNFKTLEDIVFIIDNIINTNDDLLEEEIEELDLIATELGEMQYYNYTNK